MAGFSDVSRIKLPDADALKVYRERTGLDLTFNSTGETSGVHVHGQPALDTEIEHRGMGECKDARQRSASPAKASNTTHLRCEAPFRFSESEAASHLGQGRGRCHRPRCRDTHDFSHAAFGKASLDDDPEETPENDQGGSEDDQKSR